ncbi:MAG: hypothetical protein DRI24_22475 [Deltaproteobacteria bacterium]|nr:MAG: hypothetical protein DRI24_22475 [Deltaproteobacteria bacterium]
MIEIMTGKRVSESEIRDVLREVMKRPDHDFNEEGSSTIYVVEVLKRFGIEAEPMKHGLTGASLRGEDGYPILLVFHHQHAVLLLRIEGYYTYYILDPSRPEDEPVGTPEVPIPMKSREFNDRWNHMVKPIGPIIKEDEK